MYLLQCPFLKVRSFTYWKKILQMISEFRLEWIILFAFQFCLSGTLPALLATFVYFFTLLYSSLDFSQTFANVVCSWKPHTCAMEEQGLLCPDDKHHIVGCSSVFNASVHQICPINRPCQINIKIRAGTQLVSWSDMYEWYACAPYYHMRWAWQIKKRETLEEEGVRLAC